MSAAISQPACPPGITRLTLGWILALIAIGFVWQSSAQTAVVSDAWWSYEQDCDGDTLRAGALQNNFARLNWFPDVAGCNGTLTVYERISYRPCGTPLWTPIYTNQPHVIVGCRSSNQQFVDIELGQSGECRDYLVEIFRAGQPIPDSVRSSTNDVQLSEHREESLGSDLCASDSFATCVSLLGRSGSQTDHTATATKEPDEPDHAANVGGHSVWFCWTAPTNLPVTFDTSGSAFDTLLAVYQGPMLNSLTVVTNNDDIAGATNRLSRVTFLPETGATYRIAVDGFGGASGLVQLNWNQTGGALPDLIVWGPAVVPIITTTNLFANDCQALEGCAVPGPRKLLRYTLETRNIGLGDLVLGDPSTNALFRWATCHGHYHFEAFAQTTLLDTNHNPVLLDTNVVAGRKVGFCIQDSARWQPTAPPGRKYDCSNMGLQAGWTDIYSRELPCQFVDITGLPAGTYLLQLTVNPDGLLEESDYANNTILVPVNIPPTNCLVPPDNDAFADAYVMSGAAFSLAEFSNCATKEAGEPNHAGNAGGRSLWFAWTPSSNQTAVLTTRRSDFDTTLAVYTGNTVNALSLVASNDDIVPNVVPQSLLSFAALAGTTYRITVDGFGNAAGTVVLNLNPPANDDFAASLVITGRSGSITGHTVGASKENSEPAHAADVGGQSVWYRWIAPTDGLVDFNTAGSGFDTTLAVYTNATLLSGIRALAANDDDPGGGGLQTSRVWFPASAGSVYRIAVDGFSGDFGELRLNWNMDARLEITTLSNGTFKLLLTGVDWQRYVLLGSTNLQDWFTNTAAITMSRGRHEYTNQPSVTNATQHRQFYRTLLVP